MRFNPLICSIVLLGISTQADAAQYILTANTTVGEFIFEFDDSTAVLGEPLASGILGDPNDGEISFLSGAGGASAFIKTTFVASDGTKTTFGAGGFQSIEKTYWPSVNGNDRYDIYASDGANTVFFQLFGRGQLANSDLLDVTDVNGALSRGGFGSASYVELSGGNAVNFSTNSFSIETVAAAVPEPATWAMFLLGFGLIGASMRRRKGTTASLLFT